MYVSLFYHTLLRDDRTGFDALVRFPVLGEVPGFPCALLLSDLEPIKKSRRALLSSDVSVVSADVFWWCFINYSTELSRQLYMLPSGLEHLALFFCYSNWHFSNPTKKSVHGRYMYNSQFQAWNDCHSLLCVTLHLVYFVSCRNWNFSLDWMKPQAGFCGSQPSFVSG